MENKEMTSKQKKEIRKQEFHQKFGRYWLIYFALGFTALLSFIGGLMLPFMRTDINVPLNWGTAGAALFYALGFILIGEGAANFWFDKVTDQDPDNNAQKWIAGIMILLSVLVSATTALATSYIIAYWVGVFDTFLTIPPWAQKYIAIVIPVMMVGHAVAGILFKSVSDEAFAEREAKSRINQARNEAAEARAAAHANYWVENATRVAKEMGEMEAENEIDALRAKIADQKARRQRLYAQDGRPAPTKSYQQTGSVPIPEEVKRMYAPGTRFNDGTQNPEAGAPDNYGPEWKNSTDITPTLDAHAWVCQKCEGSNAPYVRKCQWCEQPRTNGSPVTAFIDLPPREDGKANSRFRS